VVWRKNLENKLRELKKRLLEINDLDSANAVLSWDQNTYMPPGGAAVRVRQSALLARLSQEKFTDPAIGRLLDDLHTYGESLPYDSDDASLIRVTRRQYERAIKVPPKFIGEFQGHMSEIFQVWTTARPKNNFPKVLPFLEKTLDYSRRLAEFFPGYEHIADPLIDYADYGVKTSHLKDLFASLRGELLPLVQKITSQPLVDDGCLHSFYPEQPQLAFSEEVARRIGYDFERGRLDKTLHPFTTRFSGGDVRITTRVLTNDLSYCLFSVLHEAGHALYEQGVSLEYDGTPLGEGTSSGVHESQSRLWENIIGRSLGFWEYFYPGLQATFSQLVRVPLSKFYSAINKVEPSLIRTEADEVTYNLHVMLRFDLELALLEGSLEVRHLPDAWRERFQYDIGILPQDDRDGVLQDSHWYSGTIGGAFQGYTLGNIMSAQFYEAALKASPQILTDIAQGKFDGLLNWLRANIYRHGRKYTADELIQRVTGGPLCIEPYIQYLKTKYRDLYNLN
jgi:carboxypeptidase Taq